MYVVLVYVVIFVHVGSFSVTNGVVTLRFNDNMQVSSISTPSYGTLPFNHTYTQYHEKESVLDLVGNVCGGTNVYTFVPKSSEGLTPKVGTLTVKCVLLVLLLL